MKYIRIYIRNKQNLDNTMESDVVAKPNSS